MYLYHKTASLCNLRLSEFSFHYSENCLVPLLLVLCASQISVTNTCNHFLTQEKVSSGSWF